MNPAWQRVIDRAPSVLAAGPGDEIPSPCNSVCRMDPVTGWCEGCLRTLDEIAAWSQLPGAARRVVWQDLRRRAQSIERTRSS